MLVPIESNSSRNKAAVADGIAVKLLNRQSLRRISHRDLRLNMVMEAAIARAV